MRRNPLAALLVAMLVLAGCAGPREELSVGIKEVPSNVLLGDGEDDPLPSAAPIPPTAIVFSDATIDDLFAFTPPTTTPRRRANTDERPATSTTVAARSACPAADPLAPAAKIASNRATAAPVPATYEFRNNGTFERSGPNAGKGTFPPASKRTVQKVTSLSNGYSFEVAAELAGTTTTTTYQVIPTSEVPGEAGMYIVAVNVRAKSQAESVTFRPALPLKLLEFPAVPGLTYTSAGTDPTSATSMRFTATVGNKVRVDACGTPLDAISLNLTEGRVDGPSTNVEFSATYAIATQFGGLIVRDLTVVKGREGDVADQTSRRNVATISSAPRDS